MMRINTRTDPWDEKTRAVTRDRRGDEPDEPLELSLEELDAEPMVALPQRVQMRMHRRFFSTKRLSFANHRFDHDHDFDDRFRFSRFRFSHSGFSHSGFSPFGFNHANRFGNAINVNRTFQSNFNPQISFGGGSIVSHNVNMNTNFQVAL